LFEGPANAVHVKNVALGTQSSKFGVGRKGIYTSIGSSTIIRGNVEESYPGTFYLTTKRFVMVSLKYGFEIPVNKITGITMLYGGFMITSNGKSHLVKTFLTPFIKRIIKLSNKLELAKQELAKLDASSKV
jgi:hypothetical protein